MPLLGQFAVFVAVALENARLFDLERRNSEAFETLAEIGREIASILDFDELLTRLAQLVKRVIDYRTFGVLMLNESEQLLELKLAVEFGESARSRASSSVRASSATRRSTKSRWSSTM